MRLRFGEIAVLSILTTVLVFLNLTPYSYADLVGTIQVGTSSYGIAYGNGNIYVANFGSNNVSVINATNTVVATIPVGTNPAGVTYGNGNAYVANYGSNTVSVIDSTNTVVATIPVGTNPAGVTYGNGNAYVTNFASNSVSVIDSTNTVVATIPVGPYPTWNAFDPDNGYVYITYLNGNSVYVVNGIVQSSSSIPTISPPTISITSLSNGTHITTSTLTVNGTASAGTTIQSVQVGIDGGALNQASGTTSWSFLTTPLGYGTHIITATVTDSNRNTASTSVTITVDTPPVTITPPTISIASPYNGALINTSTLTVNGTASAGTTIQSVQVGIDGGALNQASGTTSWSFLTTPLGYGTHIITATVTDSNRNTASTSVTITVDTPPVLTMPADMIVFPASISGTLITYTVTATDDSGPVSIVCSPSSGSTFSIGTKAVICTASDIAGNKVTGSFNLTVLNPGQAIQQLTNIVNSMNLPSYVTSSLDTKLSNALYSYNIGAMNNAKNNLNSFQNKASSYCCNSYPVKPLTNSQANLLMIDAQNIINSIP